MPRKKQGIMAGSDFSSIDTSKMLTSKGRGLLDWRDNPPSVEGTHPIQHALYEDAVYLDRIFERLYTKSPTFRAEVHARKNPLPQMTQLGNCKVRGKTCGGVYDQKSGQITINRKYLKKDPLNAWGLHVTAHEWRHINDTVPFGPG